MNTILSARTAGEVERLLKHRERKEKASVSLSGELLRAAESLSGDDGRSAFIERAVRSYLRALVRRARDQRDLEAINARAEVTNRESDALLRFQAWPAPD